MNRPSQILLLVLNLASLPQARAAAPATLRFANESMDQLHGSFESFSGDQLVWSAAALREPTAFWTRSLLELRQPAATPSPTNVSHLASLTLTNGDSVRGQLVSVNNEKITLDTWYAGRLEFRRPMVREINIDAPDNLIYEGPNSLDGWLQTQPDSTPPWKFEKDALTANTVGGLGRDFKLPHAVSIAFDLTWREAPNLLLNVFVEEPGKPRPNRGYQIDMQGGYASVRRLGANMQGDGMLSIPEFREGEKAQLEIRANHQTGDVAVYINGKVRRNWRDPNPGGKFGTGIQFFTQPGIQSVQISKIRIRKWDGILEDAPNDDPFMQGLGIRRFPPNNEAPDNANTPKTPTKEEPTGTRMKLTNGDSIAGEVTSVEDGTIAIKTPFADVKLPIVRLRNIALTPTDLEEPIRRNGDVRAWFADDTSIVFRLDAATKDTLTGHSQTFGTATFKADAFKRIEFNIHEPAVNDLRLGPES